MRPVMRPETPPAASRRARGVARAAMRAGARGLTVFEAPGLWCGGMARSLGFLFVTFWQTLWRRAAGGPARANWPFGFEVMIRALRKDWDATSDWELTRVRKGLDARPYPAAMMKQLVTRDGELG